MIKRWLILWIEFILFVSLFFMIGFLYIEPHLKKEFEEIISKIVGLNAEVEYFYFSPTGKIEGKNLKISGKNETLGEVNLIIKEFKMEPQEFIYKHILRAKDKFDWRELDYQATVQVLDLKSTRAVVFAPEVDVVLKNRKSTLTLKEFNAHFFDHNLQADSISVQLSTQKQKTDDLIDLLLGLVIKNLQLRGANKGDISYLEVNKKDSGWNVKGAMGVFEKSMDVSCRVQRQGKSYWQVDGHHTLKEFDKTIDYQIKGPASRTGPWSVHVVDDSRNKFDLDVTLSAEKEWVGTWSMVMENFNWLSLNSPALKGEVHGGVSVLPELKKGKFHLQASGLSGGPWNTQEGSILFDAEFAEDEVMISKLLLGEKDLWSGNLQGALSTKDFTPSHIELKVEDFPLGKYTPIISGKIDIQASCLGTDLDFRLHSDVLHPDKNPLRLMKNFSVHLLIDKDRVSFNQIFDQVDHRNEIHADVLAKNVLKSPLEIKEGQLVKFQSLSPLFDLNLVEEVPVKINIEGMELDKIHIDDKNKRLRHLRGQAYIPFFQAPKLDIRASGYLDMEQFPSIAGSPASGRIDISDAVWDKGWSIRNIVARLEGSRLSVKPGAIFPDLKVDHCEGEIKNMSIYFNKIEGMSKSEGKLSVEGHYNIQDRYLDLKINARELNYESKEYHMKYDLDNLLVQGKTTDLSISGNLNVSRFSYTEPFTVTKSQGGGIKRPPIVPPEALDYKHKVNIRVNGEKSLELNNNVGKLSFVTKDLVIKGPIENVKWTGVIVTTTSPDNKLSIPIQPLEVKMNAREVSLQFDGEDGWDPKYKVKADMEVDGVQILLDFVGRLADFTRGDFNLTSVPSYPREVILKIIVDGHRPQRELYDSPTQDKQESSIEGFNIIDRKFTPGPLKETTYRARVTSGSDPFEFSVNYDLAKYIQAEVAQRSENNTFVGLRFSKQADHWNQLIDFAQGAAKKEKVRHNIKWEVSGLPEHFMSPSMKVLRDKLRTIEPVLHEKKFAEARKLLEKTMSQYLADQGFMNASYSINEISHGITHIDRRGGQRKQKFIKSKIVIDVQTGDRFSLEKVQILNWPKLVPLFEDHWLKPYTLRRHIYNHSHLDLFKEKALARLAEYGYPSATIKSIEVNRIKDEQVQEMDSRHKILYSEITRGHGLRKRKYTYPLLMHVKIEPGERHTVEQLVFNGLNAMTHTQAMWIMGYSPKKIYRETELEKYRTRLLDWYEANGHFDMNISYRVLISRRFNRTSVHFNINEGFKWRIRYVKFKGLKKANAETLLKVVKVKPDTMAVYRDIKNSEDELHRLNVFNRVETKFIEVREGVKDVVFHVEEIPRISFSTRLGYETSEGIQGSFRVRLQNITGLGRSLALENDFSSVETIRKLVYSDAFLLQHDVAGQIALGERIELISANEITNRQRLIETGLVKNIQDISHQSLFIAYQEDRNRAGRFPSIRLRFNGDFRRARASESPQPGFGFSTRNTLVNYMKESVSAYFGDYTLSYGFKMGGSLLTPWFRFGHTLKMDEFDVPLADRMFLGGTNSLRGFKEDEISGSQSRGGESLTSFGVQLFYPLNNWIDGTIFIDAGRIYDDDSGGPLDDFFSSGGLGSVLRTPVGPIQIYFAKPTDGTQGRFGIQLGTIF